MLACTSHSSTQTFGLANYEAKRNITLGFLTSAVSISGLWALDKLRVACAKKQESISPFPEAARVMRTAIISTGIQVPRREPLELENLAAAP